MRIKHFDYCVFLLSSYKRFREAIIYGGKSTIKVKEVKVHHSTRTKLNKIDKQLTGESHHDDSRQAHFTKEKSNNESFTGNSKYKNLVCNWCHKKRGIRVDCWTRKKNANIIKLSEGDGDKCDVLSVTDGSVGNKDR